MGLIKSFIVAFSIYSKIPMPRFNWESEDMKYHLIFFPWVGALIGGLEWLWFYLTKTYGIGECARIAIAGAIPLLVTGGFHVDGFMDTMDAIHSYQDKEKKLEILKDPHIGAFSVICLLTYVLVGIGALSMVNGKEEMVVICSVFFLARGLSGISVVTMKAANKKGMLATFSDTASKKIVLGGLILECMACAFMMISLSVVYGLAVVSCSLCYFGYYHHMSKTKFGGITGDLAGFFVTITELAALVVVAVVKLVIFKGV